MHTVAEKPQSKTGSEQTELAQQIHLSRCEADLCCMRIAMECTLHMPAPACGHGWITLIDQVSGSSLKQRLRGFRCRKHMMNETAIAVPLMISVGHPQTRDDASQIEEAE